MKRILSMALVAAMLLSMMLFTLVPASAADEVDGMWNTYGLASESDPDYKGEKKSVPGFEYTADGFKMTTADWSTSSPFSQMSTIDKVDLKEGVYMQVRVDDFDYDASDRWFNFFLWSTPTIDEGATGYGEGLQALIRMGSSTDEAKPGKLSSVTWYKDEFTSNGSTNFENAESFIVDGKNVLTFVVTYDEANGFSASVNGAVATEKEIEYLNEHFGENSMAHVGFAMLSSKAGGSQEATILKFGKTEADAEAPVSAGTDSKDAEDHVLDFAEIAGADTVEAGKPAILMTGDLGTSHLSNVPKSNIGNNISITTDYTVLCKGDIKGVDTGKWLVDSDVSFAIEDFPVVMCITKNLCACASGDGKCYAFEQGSAYLMTGDSFTAANDNKLSSFEICANAYSIDGDNYLYFWYDTSWNGDQFQGRINGTHFTFNVDNETVGANQYEVVLQAFFKTEEDAEAFAVEYFKSIGWIDGGDPVDPPVGGVDTDPVDTDPVETDPKTEDTTPKTEDPKPEQKPETEKQEETTGGCASVVGFGAVAIVAVAAVAGFVTFKKKD